MSCIDDLPNDIIKMIASYFNMFYQISVLRYISKKWKSLLDTDESITPNYTMPLLAVTPIRYVKWPYYVHTDNSEVFLFDLSTTTPRLVFTSNLSTMAGYIIKVDITTKTIWVFNPFPLLFSPKGDIIKYSFTDAPERVEKVINCPISKPDILLSCKVVDDDWAIIFNCRTLEYVLFSFKTETFEVNDIHPNCFVADLYQQQYGRYMIGYNDYLNPYIFDLIKKKIVYQTNFIAIDNKFTSGSDKYFVISTDTGVKILLLQDDSTWKEYFVPGLDTSHSKIFVGKNLILISDHYTDIGYYTDSEEITLQNVQHINLYNLKCSFFFEQNMLLTESGNILGVYTFNKRGQIIYVQFNSSLLSTIDNNHFGIYSNFNYSIIPKSNILNEIGCISSSFIPQAILIYRSKSLFYLYSTTNFTLSLINMTSNGPLILTNYHYGVSFTKIVCKESIVVAYSSFGQSFHLFKLNDKNPSVQCTKLDNIKFSFPNIYILESVIVIILPPVWIVDFNGKGLHYIPYNLHESKKPYQIDDFVYVGDLEINLTTGTIFQLSFPPNCVGKYYAIFRDPENSNTSHLFHRETRTETMKMELFFILSDERLISFNSSPMQLTIWTSNLTTHLEIIPIKQEDGIDVLTDVEEIFDLAFGLYLVIARPHSFSIFKDKNNKIFIQDAPPECYAIRSTNINKSRTEIYLCNTKSFLGKVIPGYPPKIIWYWADYISSSLFLSESHSIVFFYDRCLVQHELITDTKRHYPIFLRQARDNFFF